MSITTRKGDDGSTGLMYNRRISKTHSRVEAYACVDELNSALGMVRATSNDDLIRGHILTVQKELVLLMGELATAVEDLPRYLKDGFKPVEESMTRRLDDMVAEMEKQDITYKGWATPGDTLNSATIDVARTVCRRAERRACTLHESDQLNNAEILRYLNRLSDLLWLMARWAESRRKEG